MSALQPARSPYTILSLVFPILFACGGAIAPSEPTSDEPATGESTVLSEGFPQAFPGRTGTVKRGFFNGPNGRFEAGYQEIDGLAVLEDDLVLEPEKTSEPGSSAEPESVGRNSTWYRWTNGIVPYEIDANLAGTDLGALQNAIAYWNGNTA